MLQYHCCPKLDNILEEKFTTTLAIILTNPRQIVQRIANILLIPSQFLGNEKATMRVTSLYCKDIVSQITNNFDFVRRNSQYYSLMVVENRKVGEAYIG